MKKKVIFFAPNIENGGIEKNIVSLGNYFISQNINIEIIYSKISIKIKKKLNKKIVLTKSEIKFNIPFFNERINNSIKSFIYLLVKLNLNKFDKILSFQDHPFAIFSSLLRNKRCIIRIANHPVGSLFYFNNKISFFLKLFTKILFYQFASLIISNSKESTKYFQRFILYKKKCITIYNPINLNRKKNKPIKRKNFLLSIGRLEKQKNFSMLINSFRTLSKKFPSLKLLIIGKGREKKKLLQDINKYNLIKKVKILNFRNPEKYYMSAKLFVLPSFFEGLPNVLLEAMSYKLPIVSSNCFSGPKEILANGKYGYLFKVNDNKDLSDKVEIALNKYHQSINKINKGFKNLKNVNFEKQCKKYLASINNCN